MKDLIIKIKDKDHALSVSNFAAKYKKGDMIPKTNDEIRIARWLDQMKKKGGWYEMSVTRERLKLIYDSSGLN